MSKLEEYTKQLETNPKFQYSTVNVYRKAIKELIGKYGENPTVEQLNKFVAVKCSKRQPHAKYAIREYLKLLGREADYLRIVPAKIRNPIRIKNFLSRSQISEVLEAIHNPMHRLIATIQAATAARSAEVITIERRRIRAEDYTDSQGIQRKRLRITIKGKGDKPRPIYLNEKLLPLIREQYNSKKGKHLFLADDVDLLEDRQFHTRVETLYKRYNESLRDASKKCGHDISTHDIRRSVANLIHDIRKAQLVLGHADMRTTTKYLSDDSEQISEIMLEHQEEI